VSIKSAPVEIYPFPHLTTEAFFDGLELEKILHELALLERTDPTSIFKSEFGEKKEWKVFPREYESINNAIEIIGSTEFISELKKKFGIEEEVDIGMDYEFDGGGYVVSPPGSFLGYHADFNFSSRVKKYRVMNLLIYMNSDYEPKNGGHLHALDPISKTVEKTVYPFLNTAFAFFTDDTSFHGVSLNKGNFFRRSFNIYYYASIPISNHQTTNPHKTIWLDIKDEHK